MPRDAYDARGIFPKKGAYAVASMIEDLIDILTQEKTQYEKLYSLSEQMRDAIVVSDVPKVSAVTEAEQNVTTDLSSLDRKRADIMRNIALVMNKDEKELTVSAIVDTLDKQPEQKRQLAVIRDQIKEIMERLARLNTQNQTLIKQSMELLEFDLTLYRSMRQAPETANYNRSAVGTGDLLGGGGFDAKQ